MKGPRTAGSLEHMRNIEQRLQWKEVRIERQEGYTSVDWQAVWTGPFTGEQWPFLEKP